jgi:hypothetical protein
LAEGFYTGQAGLCLFGGKKGKIVELRVKKKIQKITPDVRK